MKKDKQKSPISIISILYSEHSPETYRGVTLDTDSDQIVFQSGNPLVDYLMAEQHGREHGRVFHSSSVDHFVADYLATRP